MNVLSIDSSSKVATIALINDEEIISEYKSLRVPI